MKCPNCEDGMILNTDQKHLRWYKKECSDCQGTGEIQEGDWWMCVLNKHEISMKRYSGKHPWGDIGPTYKDNEVEPLYRMIKAD